VQPPATLHSTDVCLLAIHYSYLRLASILSIYACLLAIHYSYQYSLYLCMSSGHTLQLPSPCQYSLYLCMSSGHTLQLPSPCQYSLYLCMSSGHTLQLPVFSLSVHVCVKLISCTVGVRSAEKLIIFYQWFSKDLLVPYFPDYKSWFFLATGVGRLRLILRCDLCADKFILLFLGNRHILWACYLYSRATYSPEITVCLILL